MVLSRPEVTPDVMSDNYVRVVTYETLMSFSLRDKLFKREVGFHQDALRGYKEISVSSEGGDDFHTLIPIQDGEVEVQVLLLTTQELENYDWWEDQYNRVVMTLASGDNAFVYVLSPHYYKDYGKNTSYALSQEDTDIISKSFE